MVCTLIDIEERASKWAFCGNRKKEHGSREPHCMCRGGIMVRGGMIMGLKKRAREKETRRNRIKLQEGRCGGGGWVWLGKKREKTKKEGGGKKKK